ncbi:hypothetical protein IL252_06725 [Halomicrobium sp. IBSBa]|uniref:Uncharacterized protein n=2 Tax=Haloarculaceae TaxID=1963268 RepID=A0A847UD59_9EURY|nr:hypothetical protein [Halomicrobium sp. IBSBa]NLV08998.1 hypothetical protein [Halomicrobium mukohataei]QGA84195.1 putative membrane protein [Halomicrobium sp. LC1Hm]
MLVSGIATSEENAPMSIAPPFDSDTVALDAQSIRTLAFRPVEATAFWTAVALPLVYPALMFGGFDGQEPFLLVAALALHVAALRLGRGHGRDG